MARAKETLSEKLGKLHAQTQNLDTKTLYIFENNKTWDYSLPKKSLCGRKLIPPKGRFKGDEYFLQFVKSGDIKLVEAIAPKVNPAPNVNTINENTQQGDKMEKLILDQPDKVTQHGKTESVVVNTNPNQVIKDHNSSNQPEKDVLLVESPMDGIDLVKG